MGGFVVGWASSGLEASLLGGSLHCSLCELERSFCVSACCHDDSLADRYHEHGSNRLVGFKERHLHRDIGIANINSAGLVGTRDVGLS